MTPKYLPAIIFVLLFMNGCLSAGRHARSTQEAQDEKRLTVGVVQREIKRGMSGADVAQVLGSPNVVSTDEESREVWIYDKITTERVYSQGSSFGSLILIGGSRESGASSTSQRTLTVIIKFDKEGKVRDFAYHASRF